MRIPAKQQKWTPPAARLEGERALAGMAAAERVVREPPSVKIKVATLEERFDALERDIRAFIADQPRVIHGGGGGKRMVAKVLARDFGITGPIGSDAPVSVTTGASPVTLPFEPIILLTSGNTGDFEEFNLPDLGSLPTPQIYEDRSILVAIVAGHDTATVRGTNWGEEFTSVDSWVRYIWTGSAWDITNSHNVSLVGSPLEVSFLKRDANGQAEWVSSTNMFENVVADPWTHLIADALGNVGYANIPIDDPSAYEEVNTVASPDVTTVVGDFNVQRIITSGSAGPEYIAIPDPAIHIEAEYQVYWFIDGSGGGGDVPTFDVSNLKMPDGSTPASVQFTEYLGPGNTFNSRMMLKSRFTHWEIFAASTGVVTP